MFSRTAMCAYRVQCGRASCSSEGRPFIRRRPDVVSVGGATVVVCDLRVSTCTAQTDSDEACTLGDDETCGEPAIEDAYCVDRDTGSLEDPRCTARCVTLDDCPRGIACDTTLGACRL